MDLLATVRKEGSRGGRADFKWSDVQNSTRREHYLGHSLMAPVGRWSKGRDLNWYAKGDGQNEDEEDPAEKAARERKEEIRRVKEAEEDALARALGLPVPQRNNANMEPVSDKRHTDKIDAEPPPYESEGLGFKRTDIGQDNAEEQDKELQFALREHRRRHRDDDRTRSPHDHRRDRDRDRNRNRDRRRHDSDKDRDVRHRRHRERSRERHSHSRRSRSRSPVRREQNDRVRDRSRSRSRSPYRSRRSNSRRH